MNVRDKQNASAVRFHGKVKWLGSLGIMLS